MRNDKRMITKMVLGGAIGLATALFLIIVVAFMWLDTDLEELFTDPDWMEWIWILITLLTPTISGIYLGWEDEDFWRVLLFPILRGVAVSVLSFLILMVIQMFIDGTILLALLAIGLCMPVGKVIVIVFDA